ncbi:MAG: cysteine desulfurase [Flavobacteriales bacterium]|nr:MAG: cysteine desulfurase [Flavobacteriales bacterium]
MKNSIYLDNAATTPLHQAVIERISEVLHIFGNPSSSHATGRKAKAVVELARKEMAGFFNISTSELIFTSGGTEANNLILHNAVHHLGVNRIITSTLEHKAVLNTVKKLSKTKAVKIDFVKPDDDGMLNYNNLNKLLKNNTGKTLVSLMHVNNEIGNLLNLQRVNNLCKENGALFHSDTVQTIGHFKLDLQAVPIDFITCSAHKFHGPKGIGFAVIKKEHGIDPLIIGGEQEHGTRAGTENVPYIAGMHTALKIALENLNDDHNYIGGLKQYFIESLKRHIPNVAFNGNGKDLKNSTYTILNVRLPKNIPMLLFQLDLKGIAASGGSACQSGSQMGSHVLDAILPEVEKNKSSVRFSFSKYNTKEELDRVIEVIKELI